MASKKISQLSTSTNPPLSGVTAVVHDGTTYKSTLSILRQTLVDSGSHVFTGSQTINGDLTITGKIPSLIIGTGSFQSGQDIQPEILHVQNSGSYNIAYFMANNPYYAQINIKNTNSGSFASTDLVLTANNGSEALHYVDLGINSSGYGGSAVGWENDAYLINSGKDIYIGTLGGTQHPAEVKLFTMGNWETPHITLHTGTTISFNTGSVSDGYEYEFSGSVKLQNELKVDGSVTASYFVGDGSQLTNLPTQSTDVSMFLSSSTFASASASFDSRINSATNEQDLSYFAITGSNSFIGNQIITGSVYIEEGQMLVVGPGSTFASAEGITLIQDTSGYIQLDANNNDGSGNYTYLTLNANNDESVFGVKDQTYGRIGSEINLSSSGSFNISTDNNTATLLINGVLYDAHLVSTSSFNSYTSSAPTLGANTFTDDQTIDGIVYFRDTAVEGGETANIVHNDGDFKITASDNGDIILGTYGTTTYEWTFNKSGSLIVPGNINGANNLATTGSNTFVGNQTINGSLIIESVSEVLTVDGGFSGNRNFDYTSGSIFYLTGLTGNGTWGIDNVPTTNNRGLTMTFVIEQGVTAFSASAYSFDSTPVTVKWVDSTIPTGSANKTEVIGLTAFRVGSSWNVLGSLSTFGS